MPIKKQVPQNKKNKTRMLGGVFFVVLVCIIPFTRNMIRSAVVFVVSPVVFATHEAENWFVDTFEALHSKSVLVAQNTDLSNQIANDTSRLAQYDELVRENKELKSVMGRASDKQFILAVVISKPPVSVYDTLLIDGGKKVGIQVGQTVYVNGDFPIGTINQVFATTAVVELYSSPSEKMDARLDPSHIDVTLFGHGGGDFLVSVPHDLVVDENSVVVSKELNPHVLGTLEKTISDPRDSSQSLIFSSPINLNELNFVEVGQ